MRFYPSLSFLLIAYVYLSIQGCSLAPDVREPVLTKEPSTADWARQSLSGESTELDDWQRVANLAPSRLTASAPLEEMTVDVSIDVTDASLGAVLEAIAKQLSVSLQLSEPLPMPVTWKIPEQSVSAVLDQLASGFNVSWALEDNTLSVKGPSAYTEVYPVDYLNLQRRFSSSVGLATEVGSMRGLDEGGRVGAENSSSTTIDNTSEHDFWRSLNQDLEVWLTDASGSERWSINQDTGLISLHASANTHRRLSHYLERVSSTSQRQVLIEASVVEVLLTDDFETGIDWQLLAKGLDGITAIQQLHGLGPLNALNASSATTPSGLLTFSERFELGDFSATFQWLEQFGDVRIVSRPQILVMNNQSAVLKVVDNRVYFTVNAARQSTDDPYERITETQIHTVPVGLVMNVTPHISANDEVMLNVRPSLSRILGFVDDPNPDLTATNRRNGVPEIQVREMESVLRVNSGSIAVIGGLMQSVQDNRDRQLPGVADLPAVGGLFAQQSRKNQRTELFIVIKPTVMHERRATLKPAGVL